MPAKLEIIFNDNQTIDVKGPINEKMFCFGLLEMAKMVIMNHKPSSLVTPSIVPAPLEK